MEDMDIPPTGARPTIDDLRLPTRLANTLKRHELIYLDDLRRHWHELVDLDGVGRGGLMHIAKELRHAAFAGDDVPADEQWGPGHSLQILRRCDRLARHVARMLD
ncbi:MAG: hypothetical protein ACYDAG_10925 [Chloroflexota bacterium]